MGGVKIGNNCNTINYKKCIYFLNEIKEGG